MDGIPQSQKCPKCTDNNHELAIARPRPQKSAKGSIKRPGKSHGAEDKSSKEEDREDDLLSSTLDYSSYGG